jgi:dolichol-phosphate mannosyltransferase
VPRIELTVVVPTFNERMACRSWSTVGASARRHRLGSRLRRRRSPDRTGDAVRDLVRRTARARDRADRPARTSSATVEGVLSAAPYFAVMDADLQHDEAVLPEMLRRLKAENLDIVVASRYQPAHHRRTDRKRQAISLCTRVSRGATPTSATR